MIFIFFTYSKLISLIETTDYKKLLEKQEVRNLVKKIRWKEDIKLDYINKTILDKYAFDLMILSIREENRDLEKSQVLSWKDKTITDIIKEINENPEVKSLDLRWSRIWETWIKALSEVLSKTQIRSLDLLWNKFWETWLEALSEVLSKTQIISLDLRNNDIWDDWLKALSEVLTETQIISLDLWWNDIWDDWLKALSKVLSKTQIRSLDLRNNDIWDEEKEKIKVLCKENNIKLKI